MWATILSTDEEPKNVACHIRRLLNLRASDYTTACGGGPFQSRVHGQDPAILALRRCRFRRLRTSRRGRVDTVSQPRELAPARRIVWSPARSGTANPSPALRSRRPVGGIADHKIARALIEKVLHHLFYHGVSASFVVAYDTSLRGHAHRAQRTHDQIPLLRTQRTFLLPCGRTEQGEEDEDSFSDTENHLDLLGALASFVDEASKKIQEQARADRVDLVSEPHLFEQAAHRVEKGPFPGKNRRLLFPGFSPTGKKKRRFVVRPAPDGLDRLGLQLPRRHGTPELAEDAVLIAFEFFRGPAEVGEDLISPRGREIVAMVFRAPSPPGGTSTAMSHLRVVAAKGPQMALEIIVVSLTILVEDQRLTKPLAKGVVIHRGDT
ncbi:hypothetical protein N7526_001976 [Penicillium atrosanguineum]|nr:hypothetical protein N7526_001976 [Penicillium atrosanguineum]